MGWSGKIERLKGAPFGMAAGIMRGSTQSAGELPRLGTRQLLEGYNLFPWLRAVVDRIASVAGAVAWNVSVRDPRTGTERYLTDHPLVTLLNGGNGLFSGSALRTLALKHLLIAGEIFWIIERNKYGMPVGLWPVSPSWVEYAPTINNEPGTFYRLQFRQWHAEIPNTEMIHLYEPNPAQPYGRGSGAGATLSDELETDEMAARYMKLYFVNGARPDLLISSADNLNPLGKETAERLETKWIERLQGWWRSHRPFFLSGGAVRVDKISPDVSDLQWVDLRKFSRDAILQMYGLPPECLGILDNSNRATIQKAETFLTKHVVVPKLTFMRDMLQHRLAPEFDRKLILGYQNPVQEDRENILELMRSNPHAFTINDIRDAADMPPLVGREGRLHPVPVNMELVNLGKVFSTKPTDPIQNPDDENDPIEPGSPDDKPEPDAKPDPDIDTDPNDPPVVD